VRRWTLLLAGAALWLFLAAIPALADGGPHVAATNSGVGGLTADSCAGCHRAHTAQGAMLLVQDQSTLCLTCHGATGTGATTNVVNGVQYNLASSGTVRGGVILGALRNGGFVTAAIGSGSAYRMAYSSTRNGLTVVSLASKVPVRVDASTGSIAGQSVTSAHMSVPGSPLTSFANTTWGNIDGTAGTSFSSTPNPGGTLGALTCTSCHNPHGNNQYRILQLIPTVTEASGGTAFKPSTTNAIVTDAALPPDGDERNYTVIEQTGGTTLLASQAAAFPNTAGDYFHRTVPWNGAITGVTTANDAPNGLPTTFDGQINAWCAQCHSRYLTTAITYPSGHGPYDTSSGDAIFTYRHSNTSNKPCTTCHVAHGSNAQMTGTYSANETYPGGIAAPVGDSRLLKVNNRGTCQACHDPTGTITAGTNVGTAPTPLTP
jgi:predicted CXXCH cytochrome family protein